MLFLLFSGVNLLDLDCGGLGDSGLARLGGSCVGLIEGE